MTLSHLQCHLSHSEPLYIEYLGNYSVYLHYDSYSSRAL